VLSGSTPPHLAYLPVNDGRVAAGALAMVTVHTARTHAMAGRPDTPRLAGRCPASGYHPGQAGQAKAEPAMGCRTRQATSRPMGHMLWAEGQPSEPWPAGRKPTQQPDFFLKFFFKLFN
jgi:hypothetical protein